LTTALAHALVLTLDAERRILTDGAVAFDGAGEILAVGPTGDVLGRLEEGARVLDCSGRVITPGFVDVHVHLGEQLMRGLVPDAAGPTEWLPDWLLPTYAALEPEEERLAAEVAIAELLLTGTTTFCEAGTLLEPEPVADAAEETGIRAQLGRWTWDLPEAPARMRATAAEALAANADMLARLRARGCSRVTGAVILLGMGTASEQLLRDAHALAEEHQVPKAMMHAGTAPEHGGRWVPATTLAEWGWADERTKLTHVVYVDDDDLALLADGGVRVAHCPTAALRHVKGIHRHGKVPEMLAAGMAVGLGGDSANGSNHFNMLRLAYLAATLYKDFRMDSTMVPPEVALEMATLHGARCLGMADQIGSLEVGKRADLVVFSTEHPEWRPMLHPVQNLVLNATDRSIESVWVDGRRLVDQGRIETMDLPAVLARADVAAGSLLQRVGLSAPWDWPRA
jgi:5-methylthioadenosine/S-adenosylhomocysteine deaminase